MIRSRGGTGNGIGGQVWSRLTLAEFARAKAMTQSSWKPEGALYVTRPLAVIAHS